MKTPVLCSLGLHVTLLALLAAAPEQPPKPPVQEKIIPVNVVVLPPPEPPAPVPAKVEEPPEAAPAQPPAAAPAPRPQPAEAPRPRLRIPVQERREPVPDLVSRLETPLAEAPSLRERVREKAPPPPPETRPVVASRKPEPAPAVVRPPAPTPPAAPAPRQTASLPRSSAPLTLQAANFPHAWFLAIVQGKIFERWTPPSRLQTLESGVSTAVRFTIGRNGSVTGISVQRSSGYTQLDRSALEAVRGVTDLPPLPADFREEKLDVVVVFQPTAG